MDNGRVFAVVDSEESEGVLDDLIEEKAKAKAEKEANRPVVKDDEVGEMNWEDTGGAGDVKAGDEE